jgi:hypothetical protein
LLKRRGALFSVYENAGTLAMTSGPAKTCPLQLSAAVVEQLRDVRSSGCPDPDKLLL